jgi:hypothetical protein
MLIILASCKFVCNQPEMKDTSLGNKEPSRQYFLSIRGIFLNLHICRSATMTYKTCNVGRDPSVMEGSIRVVSVSLHPL